MAPSISARQRLDLSRVNLQTQSPLYNTFPTELRLAIYSFVVASFPNPNDPYPFQSYYYRPGYTAPRISDLRLLRVCKQVYLEAKDLIWDAASGHTEEAFWWGDNKRRPPTHGEQPERPGAWIREDNHPFQSVRTRTFTVDNWSKITKVEIFSQMYACKGETFKAFFDTVPFLQPKVVKVTIRYTDWWWWEDNRPLDLTIAPGKKARKFLPDSCETFLLELETIESKKNQLKEQVKRIADNKELWEWPRMDGKRLVLDEAVAVKDWEWMGPTKFSDLSYFHHPLGDEMKYCVKILTFNLRK